MNGSRTIVTIDGPAGAGKSTVARALARRLGFRFLDTGAMYRAVTWAALDAGVPPEDDAGLRDLLDRIRIELDADGSVFVDKQDVTTAIRSPDVTRSVSAYAARPAVRRAMTALQRRIGAAGRLVCEGRDMGSHVFPDAAVRIYLDASVDVRAERRHRELVAAGRATDIDRLKREIAERDAADSTRETAPLTRVKGQTYIDSSDMGQEEVVDACEAVARARLLGDLE